VVARALMASTPAMADAGGAPTYGELIGLARHRAREASATGSGPFPSADQATEAVAGFERYLAVLGRHLRLIVAPGLAPAPGHLDSLPVLQQLIERMSHLELAPSNGSPWGRAAEALATAHDLLATHLGPFGERRTPEVEVLADPHHRHATARMVLRLLDEPLAVRDDLLRALTVAQRGADREPSPRAVAAHIRQSTDAIARLTNRYAPPPFTSSINIPEVVALIPAIHNRAGSSGARSFDDSIQALRVLRLLSYRQTNGLEPASPGCLHDLARLARTATAGSDQWLPTPETAIARVQRAHAIDHLERARQAWTDTSVALGQHIRGLTKAPRVYADAIGAVQEAHAHEGVRRAVLAALPRLGREAGLTTTHLARTGCVSIATKEVGRFQESWRLLTPDEGDVLAARFTRSGQASRTASIAVSQLDRATDRRDHTPETVSANRGLEQGRVLGGRSL
jgi:hypothetical protein